jgi:hypothetical protein
VPLLNFGQPMAARDPVQGLVRANEDWIAVAGVKL